jgi:hypothetical protein
MFRFLIKCANCAFLVLVVVGIPAITHVQFRSILIGSAPTLQLLSFWSLALALALNAGAASFVIKSRKDRMLCWEWAAVYGVLLFAYSAFVLGYLSFDWLKRFLLRLQHYF